MGKQLIVSRDARGKPFHDTAVVKGKRYSSAAVLPDGTEILEQWSPEDEARRDAEDAAFAAQYAAEKPIRDALERGDLKEADRLHEEARKAKA